jgi:hypothetical protein
MPSVSKDRKLFDLEEANRTLPLVSRIVRDIVDVNSQMRDLHLEAQRCLTGGGSRGGKTGRAEGLQDRLQELGYERAQYVEELEDLGIELKDPNLGLVDFPAMLDGRLVCLCWKLGEESITHWHEVNAGFAGRQPVEGHFHRGERGGRFV